MVLQPFPISVCSRTNWAWKISCCFLGFHLYFLFLLGHFFEHHASSKFRMHHQRPFGFERSITLWANDSLFMTIHVVIQSWFVVELFPTYSARKSCFLTGLFFDVFVPRHFTREYCGAFVTLEPSQSDLASFTFDMDQQSRPMTKSLITVRASEKLSMTEHVISHLEPSVEFFCRNMNTNKLLFHLVECSRLHVALLFRPFLYLTGGPGHLLGV